MNKATSLSSSHTLFSLIAPASAVRRLLRAIDCSSGKYASLNLSLSSDSRNSWMVRALGGFVKVGDEVSEGCV